MGFVQQLLNLIEYGWGFPLNLGMHMSEAFTYVGIDIP